MTFWYGAICIAYSKTCLKRTLKKKTKIGFQGRLSLNADQKYCRMLPFRPSLGYILFIKIFVLSIFESQVTTQ